VADPRYDDRSIADEDRLLRFYAHERYRPLIAPDETAAGLGPAALTERLSTFGFQAIRDSRSGLFGMSMYVERLLPAQEGPDGLLQWWIDKTGFPHSLVMILAASLRAGDVGLGLRMDVVDEPFGEAHVNVALPVEGGDKFSKPLRRRIVAAAQVVLP
jgi:hypothetical protein